MSVADAQPSGNRLAQLVQAGKTKEIFQPVSPFKMSKDEPDFSFIKKGTVLSATKTDLKKLVQDDAEAITLTVPSESNGHFVLELVKADIGGDYLNVTLKGSGRKLKIFSGLHYRGIVKGNVNSYAAISIYENKISGIISNGTGNFVLVPFKNKKDKYIFYNDHDLVKPLQPGCITRDFDVPSSLSSLRHDGNSKIEAEECIKTVKVFYECDYYMYSDPTNGFNGNATDLTNFISSAFNQVATLYANISAGSVICEISEILIFDTQGSDYLDQEFPWSSTATTGGIEHFISTIVEHEGSSFNGDVAQLITTRHDIHPPNVKGLAAKVGSVCNKYLAHSIVNIYDISPVDDYPDYSLTVFLMAHEMGHTMGSPHTHACFWNGNNTPIDGCYGAEPNCFTSVSCSTGTVPTSGTIMSYCNTGNNPGVDFSLGFGTQPGDLIYNVVADAECLTGSLLNIPTNLTSDASLLRWDAGASGNEFTVQYKLLIDDGCEYQNQWLTIDNITSTSYDYVSNASLFVPGAVYIWRVSADCSPYSQICDVPAYTFSIPATSDPVPSKLEQYDLSVHGVTLCWDHCCGTYDVQYKETTATTWITAVTGVNRNYYRFNDMMLDPGTYEWQVCASGSQNWSSSSYFDIAADAYDTQNGYYCHPPDYSDNLCDPTDASQYYIGAMSFACYTNSSSGGSTDGYQDFRTPQNFNCGTSIPNYAHLWVSSSTYRVNLSFTGGPAFVAIFIDWNRDGDYFDEGEDAVRYFGDIPTNSHVNGDCIVPSDFIPGWTNIRVMVEDFESDQNAVWAPYQCGFNGDGEIEDYLSDLSSMEYCNPAAWRIGFTLQPSEVTIFPVPVSEMLTIQTGNNGDTDDMLVAQIYDLTGALIRQIPMDKPMQNINVSSLAPGVYQLSLFSAKNNTLTNKRFVKL